LTLLDHRQDDESEHEKDQPQYGADGLFWNGRKRFIEEAEKRGVIEAGQETEGRFRERGRPFPEDGEIALDSIEDRRKR
jgi:hypothetical protein